MDEVIKRATDLINQILETMPQWDIFTLNTKTRLIDTRNLLNRLVHSDLPKNDQTRLFCRQLKRLMNYNDSLSQNFWIKLHDDILYILEKSNGKQGTDTSWNRFISRINFEEKLEQRELQLRQISGEQKSLTDLFYEHKTFFEKYLQKCISLHSKVQVQGLIENMDDFLYRIYGLTKVSLTLEDRQQLNEKLKSIKIPLNWSNRSLNSLGSQFFINNNSSERVNNDPSNFLPSQRIDMNSSDDPEIIEDILGCNRWILILGDPGSAKTTLLRWVACVFAKAARHGQKKVDLKGSYRLPVRIPILIRIGEFAAWFNRNRTKTLMDYIGEHTWFSERYCDDEGGRVLKELICHGHTLILLDGLDEISDVRQRSEIVELVEKFVDEYIRAPDFISAFDNRTFAPMSLLYGENLVETQPPSKSGGNQIVVTSRIVGYQFRPLNGPYVQHYTLSLMDHQEAKEFVRKWMRQVDKSVRDILLNEGIKLGRKTVKIALKKVFSVGEAIFENSSELLMSNPSLLSLICTFIFQSSIEFHPRSRVEVYNHAVEAALHAWKKQEPSILESDLTNFLIDLAMYLHLQSPSGLIDAFDIEHLCCVTLKRQEILYNRVKLHEYAKKIISLLESNIGIVAERGLQIFGFLHLSFQEYFVAQMFVRDSNIDHVVKRMLLSTLNPRFRESLLLAFGWISWKWPFHKYNKFCHFLITGTENHTMPFETLLFFDVINDMYRLPSNLIIFIALNNLMNHPSDVMRNTYLISNLSKLPENTIIEWMESHLKDDKCLLKFCHSFPVKDKTYVDTTQTVRKRIPSVVYQQLWAFHLRNSSTEFLIDQILRRTLVSDDISDHIFNKDLSLYFVSQSIYASSIHPLILSVIIAVCGGIYFIISENDIFKIDFSPKQMHRESSIIGPIIKYLTNNEEPHLTKVQTLIAQYESILQKSSPSDKSIDIIDTFIALICLQGLSQALIYQKYDGYQALPLALERLRQTWFYFKELCNPDQRGGYSIDISFMISEMDSIIKTFSSQDNESDEQCMSFSVACASAWKKLGLWTLSNKRNIDGFASNERVGRYFHCQPDFMHFIGEKELDQVVKNIHSLHMLQSKLSILLIFLPQSLQPLYYYVTVSLADNRDSLPLIVLLSECLMRLEVVDKYDWNFDLAVPMLQPILKEHMLENYVIVLNRERYSDPQLLSDDRTKFRKAIGEHKLLDSFKDQSKDVKILISIERQRIRDSKGMLQNQEKDVRLFAASFSLARLFQAQYRSHKYPTIPTISVSLAESEEVYFAITDISDPVLRIIALSIILEMKDPAILHEEQRDEIRWEMINLFQSLLPSLSLLTSVLLFVWCHTAREFFPASFQRIASIIGEKLNEPVTDAQHREQEAAYIALRQLNNSDLSNDLSDFAKRKKNLSDLLRFNSTIFYQYFTNATSFGSLNTVLLSSMYLVELAFDAQILKIYCKSSQQNNIPPLKELEQLWNESSKAEKIMTLKVARWITNYLQIWNKDEIQQIIKDICRCQLIERKALSEIEKWLDYRMDENLRIFAHYAALQLISGGSHISNLMDIIEEMFLIDKKIRLASIVANVVSSRVVDLTVLHQILITLERNIYHSSKVCVLTDRKETLEIILNLELNRITSNACRSFETSTNPFLLMIRVCSTDLQNYLIEYLRTFIDKQTKIENLAKEEYVAVVIKWIIESSVWYETRKNFSIELHKYLFELLHNQQFSRIQKTIANAINSVFIHPEVRKDNIFLQDDAIINLERVIRSWNTYSEDAVTLCLLTYGNYLLKLQKFRVIRNISDEMKNTLTVLFETSFSEIISIRAGFCLIFAEQSNVKFSTVLSWFSNKWNITPTKKYNILLQQTLFYMKNESITSREWQARGHLQRNYAEVVETFVIHLYNYLCIKDNNNYLSSSEPNYVKIAMCFSGKNLNEFCNAIQKSCFDENELKKRLCLRFKNNPRDGAALIELYSIFGTLTEELVDMLELFDDDEYWGTSLSLTNLKQVSDRDAIERLFEVINLKISNGKQIKSCLQVLRSLVEVDAISMLEVHRRFSLINNMSRKDDDDERRNCEEEIFKLLVDFSCFKTDLLLSSTKKLFSESDIDEKFEREFQNLDKNSPLLLQNLFS